MAEIVETRCCREIIFKKAYTFVLWLTFVNISYAYVLLLGARGSLVVKALRYKPEGRGVETR
jgi:hypothetical protein